MMPERDRHKSDAVTAFVQQKRLSDISVQERLSGVQSGLCCPDVTHEEAKVSVRLISRLMLHMGKTGMWRRVQCGAGCSFPDVIDGEGKVCARAIFSLM